MLCFRQGCAGDINPVGYKEVDTPRHAEPLGTLLGLSALQALRAAEPPKAPPAVRVLRGVVSLPRVDSAERIAALEARECTPRSAESVA
jgi:hypothetical protein